MDQRLKSDALFKVLNCTKQRCVDDIHKSQLNICLAVTQFMTVSLLSESEDKVMYLLLLQSRRGNILTNFKGKEEQHQKENSTLVAD